MSLKDIWAAVAAYVVNLATTIWTTDLRSLAAPVLGFLFFFAWIIVPPRASDRIWNLFRRRQWLFICHLIVGFVVAIALMQIR